MSCGRFGHRNIDAWIQHMVLTIFAKMCCQCLDDSDIERLEKRNRSTRDMLHFYVKLSNIHHHHQCHVASVGMQNEKQNNSFWCHFNIGLDNIVNPFDHGTLVYPHIFQWKIWELFVHNLSALGSFQDKHRSQMCTILWVALFCHLLKYEYWLLFFLSTPMFSLSEKGRRLGSDVNNKFWTMILLHTFWLPV